MKSSEIEDGKTGDTVGTVRRFVLGEDVIREHLLALSDIDRMCKYEFAEPVPFPVTNYVATVKVHQVTETNESFVEWFVTFDCERQDQEYFEQFFAQEVFKPALASLEKYLSTTHRTTRS
ncbi:SRPBCC family protein [Actinotignum urinale]|uniref:SRPBCC family protein n=1 Tax=Actinotignum urinale TaxID=190146 RepID=UPI0003B68DB3